MADVFSIAGRNETVFNSDDFAQLVEKYMGHEAAIYFADYAANADEKVRRAQDGEASDLAYYEASLEEAIRALQDIQDEVDAVFDVLAQKRVDRLKISRILHRINAIIDGQV